MIKLKELLDLKVQECSLIEKIRKDNLPIVIWGAGSLAFNTRRMLQYYNLEAVAYWVDSNKSEKYHEGLPVLTIEECCENFQKFNVVCGHSHYELVEKTEISIDSINKIYCFVNICYGRWEGIKKEFIEQHYKLYEENYELLEDEISRKCFAAYLNCKCNEDYRFLIPCCENLLSYFNNPFFILYKDERYLDIGAYDGDTLIEFIKASDGQFSKIIAIEPEEESYKKLEEFVESLPVEQRKKIACYKYGGWNKDNVLCFEENEESSSISLGGNNSIIVKRLDKQFAEEGISLIKINFLYGVYETISGLEKVLKVDKPNLVITVGFDEYALMKIPKLIKEINPSYKLDIRYAAPMPARLILYAY